MSFTYKFCVQQFHGTPIIMTLTNLWPQLLAGDGPTLLRCSVCVPVAGYNVYGRFKDACMHNVHVEEYARLLPINE